MTDTPVTVPVVSIVGKGDSGKTTFLEKLIRELAARGVRVATVKHHVHDFDIDVPGKDSWRHARAGAAATMVSSPTSSRSSSRCERECTLPELAHVAAEAGCDILLTEGFKRAGDRAHRGRRAARAARSSSPTPTSSSRSSPTSPRSCPQGVARLRPRRRGRRRRPHRARVPERRRAPRWPPTRTAAASTTCASALTDRCNLRCVYCMPAEGVAWKPHDEMLTFEEIERFAADRGRRGHQQDPPHRRRAARAPGRRRPRAPPARDPRPRGDRADHQRDAAAQVRRAAARGRALERVNISLDSLDPEVYARITRGGKLADALAGLDAAFDVGFDPVKLNVVVVRSLDQDLLGFAKLTLDRPLHVRFIEYMPVGRRRGGPGCHSDIGTVDTEGWTRADTVPSDEVVARIAERGRGRRSRRARRRSRATTRPAAGARRATTASRARRARSASSRRCRTTSAPSATACASPPTAGCARASSRDDELDVRTRPARRVPTRTCARSSARRSPTSPKATTCASAPRAACPRSEDDA